MLPELNHALFRFFTSKPERSEKRESSGSKFYESVVLNGNCLIARKLEIPELIEIIPRKYFDKRGFFFEAYQEECFQRLGIHERFVQDNHAYSKYKGTIRGLHFQKQPRPQAKLLRVIRGAIFDVACDMREGSKTFGKCVCLNISNSKANLLFVPQGFAHGYCTLEDDTEVLYKVTNLYNPSLEGGIYYDDPALAIPWPFSKEEHILSKKDQNYPSLQELTNKSLSCESS